MSDINENTNDEKDEGAHPHPGWRNALRLFIEEGKDYGNFIGHAWFYEAFEIPMPADETPFKEAKKLQLQFANQFEHLRMALLEERQMDLVNVFGEGYVVIKPEDQTSRARSDFQKDLVRTFRKTTARVANVDHSLLSDEQQRENTDEIARLSNLRGFFRKAYRRLPPPKKNGGEKN